MTPAKTIAGLRKAPQQARSKARAEAIFAAARRILDAEGVEALTMRRISTESEVSTGSLYQFFEDKSAVLTAVTGHYMDTFSAAIAGLVERASEEPWPELIGSVFDGYVELYRQHPGYLAIRIGRHLTPELLLADAANNNRVADGVRRILVAREDLTDGPALATACRAGVCAADALLQLAFRTAPEGDPAMLAEAKRIVGLYLTDIVADPRYRTG
ncbi:TetR family transcriptional regulator [Streptomyces sp. NPDC058470]|uniref:TetR family transcriptional regulator n=1 Tax=Streptomyces sp. NPDC058470 TaxID=3346515 RepID=UPI003669932A